MPLFARHRATLNALSEKTGTPVVSLIASFAVLHEVTAILPLIGFFYAGRWGGLGELTVNYLSQQDSAELDWLGRRYNRWIEEGHDWAQRVGKRYGLMGFEKAEKGKSEIRKVDGTKIAGDVANAVFAYGATKMIMPLRIAACLYLSPAFSRAFVDPFRRVITNKLRRRDVQ